MIKKYHDFINEEIYNGVKKCVSLMRNSFEIKNGNWPVDYLEDTDIGLRFFVKIKISKPENIPMYYSNISAKEILQKNFDNFTIEFLIKDDKIDENKFFSILHHELTHVFQLGDPEDKYFDSFMKGIAVEDFKKITNKFDKFLSYIYYNFEHELDAREAQTYEYYRMFKKGVEFKEAWQDFLNKELYGALKYINNFNGKEFITTWPIKENLLTVTNQFNLIYGLEQIKLNELENYYKKWEKMFKNNFKIYSEKCRQTILNAINDVQQYEKHILWCYDETPLYEDNYYPDIDAEMQKIVAKFKQIQI